MKKITPPSVSTFLREDQPHLIPWHNACTINRSMNDARLFIVSNRLPTKAISTLNHRLSLKSSVGGLVAGLRATHRSERSLWIGHSGIFQSDPQWREVEEKFEERRMVPVPLEKSEYNRYYQGLSNQVLWPLFHSFWQSMNMRPDDWEAYVRVNQKFAETILSKCKEESMVWIHDYHLCLLPQLLRKTHPFLNISFFLHIPFPEPSIFRMFAKRQELLSGLLGADTIGFHIKEYEDNFKQSVLKYLPGSSVEESSIRYQGRHIELLHVPLGAAVEEIEEAKFKTMQLPFYRKLKNDFRGKQVLLGVDRLDYTKGVPNKLKAFKRFLATRPQFYGKVTLIQLVFPSRRGIPAYEAEKQEVEELVGSINGEFSRPGYQPIMYLFREISQVSLVALYKLADAMLVTSLKDGLNLVAKEYVVARGENYGRLLLSEAAGAIEEMPEAFAINPSDQESIIQALQKALEMPPKELEERMCPLLKRMRKNSSAVWAEKFVREWEKQTLNVLGEDRMVAEG